MLKDNATTIGTPVPRIDGPYKTTGTAKYASDHNFPGLLHAVPVCATIAKGKITGIDTAAAEAMRGVLKIYHYGNAPHLYRPIPRDARVDEARPAFEDEYVYYSGQYVAVVVAETIEQARAAARAVKVMYAAEKPDNRLDLSEGLQEDALHEANKRGDVDTAFALGAVKVDATYITPVETHNPMELHASVATYYDGKFVLYETTQSIVNHRAAMAQILGVPVENVQIIMKFLGSGFGGKLWVWQHSLLAASAARDLRRPVKLVTDRHSQFTNVGHRPRTQQRLRLAATAEGKLTCIQHDYSSETSILDNVGENCGESTPFLWSTPNLRVRSSMSRRNVGTPTAMRGPGAVPGLFALESAMDELAIRLKMDPVQLRLLNEPEKDESNGLPFSSRHMKECLTLGAEKFGWAKRNPVVGSMKKPDGTILGWGMAGASWGAGRIPTSTNFAFRDDGSVRIGCATQDIGTGTYTVFSQMVHHITGISMGRIEVALGDTSLPPGPLSGGSRVTGSLFPAIQDAVNAATKQLLQIAVNGVRSPFKGAKLDDLGFSEGRVYRKADGSASGVSFEDVLSSANLRFAIGEGSSVASQQDPKAKGLSLHSFGAQFVEVEWDPGIARLRVSRVVTVIDGGQIINLKAATNQVEGAIVMGVGMGLLEETVYDQRYGHPVNANYADYLVATQADCPPAIDVTFLDYPDKAMSEIGARGIGEIGLAGVAPAITAAVYHASGVRVRELPVRMEDLLQTVTQKHRA
ncbi:xanthine dehydrogenase family protein molybdopterin-binding subunit [Terriglobus sp. 2YAB30_2]|uniref:xanthine dehydrogenase family protein molybdopterin-binding subunit n=1 Tax=unclassified Terriglobus TaxID=2628988 RepID=UPI003F9B5B17